MQFLVLKNGGKKWEQTVGFVMLCVIIFLTARLCRRMALKRSGSHRNSSMCSEEGNTQECNNPIEMQTVQMHQSEQSPKYHSQQHQTNSHLHPKQNYSPEQNLTEI